MADTVIRGAHPRRDNDAADREYYDVRQSRTEYLNNVRADYAGLNIGASFFGWLVASGLAIIITSILAAAGVSLALYKMQSSVQGLLNSGSLSAIGWGGGILFLLTLAVAYYAGGYVAGRMSRFNSIAQGMGVWVFGIIFTLIVGGAGAAFGSKYNVFQNLNLPFIPVNGISFSRAGLITTLLALLVTFLAAVAGARTGIRYHRKLDETLVNA